ncbi:hypothetical protein H0H87_010703 [Tephrocybe sp. NHM501043]|nr:hypothetical protein H0H87_010703 [Tephrocybe sp. NHM501043]
MSLPRQTVNALLGFAIFVMAAVMTLAGPLLLGEPSFPPDEKLSLPDPPHEKEKANVYFHRVLEVIPDADKDLLLLVIQDILSNREDVSLDRVIDVIFDKIGANGDVQVSLVDNVEHDVESVN